MRFHSRIIGSRDLSFCQKKVSLVKIDEEFWAVRECGSVGLWLLWFSANLRGIKDPVPPAVQVSTSWETVWDHKTYSEVKTVQRHQNLVTIEDSSPLKTVQRQRKLLTATWLAIPECQVLAIARGLVPSLACQLISGRCNPTSFLYNLNRWNILIFSIYSPRRQGAF